MGPTLKNLIWRTKSKMAAIHVYIFKNTYFYQYLQHKTLPIKIFHDQNYLLSIFIHNDI